MLCPLPIITFFTDQTAQNSQSQNFDPSKCSVQN